MNPELFLSMAQTLKSTAGRPEFYRTAIGRAYYAAYNVGIQVLDSFGIRLKSGPGGHGELQQCLGACGDSDCVRISDRLRTLHSRRIRADYRMNDGPSETPDEAEAACLDALQIVKVLKSLRDEDGKSRAEQK